MSGVFPVLIVLALAATLSVLVFGLFTMAKGGEFNRKHGNRLMRWRVLMQATALVLIALALFTAKH